MPAVLGVALGLILGVCAGGRIRLVKGIHLSWGWFVIPLYVAQAFSRGRLPGLGTQSEATSVIWLASSIALAVSLTIDLRRPGVCLLWAGVLANALVFLANGAMPVSVPEALNYTASGTSALPDSGFYQVVSESSMVVWLGDILPVSLFGQALVLSVGDMLLLVGIIVAIVAAMTQHEDSVLRRDT